MAQSLNTLRRWKESLGSVMIEMDLKDETVLGDHIESIIADLDFQIQEQLAFGPIVERRQ